MKLLRLATAVIVANHVLTLRSLLNLGATTQWGLGIQQEGALDSCTCSLSSSSRGQLKDLFLVSCNTLKMLHAPRYSIIKRRIAVEKLQSARACVYYFMYEECVPLVVCIVPLCGCAVLLWVISWGRCNSAVVPDGCPFVTNTFS